MTIQSAHDEVHAEDLDWVNSRSADSRVALWPSAPQQTHCRRTAVTVFTQS
jgi:hypothetical protein